jgi:hypothetical protein
MNDETITYRRTELYDKVWKDPVRTVARRYGISDVWLGKVCRKLSVPLPGRGYWARVRNGWPEKQLPLPPLPEGKRSEITVPTRRQQVFIGRLLRQEDVEEARAKPPVIVVPDELERPHKLVTAAGKLLRGRESHDGYISCWNISCLKIHVTKASLGRALRIMNALLGALEERNYRVEVTRALSSEERQRQDRHQIDPPDNVTRVLVGEEWIEFGIFGKSRIVRETAEQPKGLKGNALESWLLSSHTTTRYMQEGDLELRILNPEYTGIRSVWGDGKHQRVEKCLGAFVAYLEVAAEAKKQRRLDLERQHREWEEKERRREEARRRALEEEEREKRLEVQLRDWRMARDTRMYAAELRRILEAHPAEAGSKWLEFLRWMEVYAERKDPVVKLRAALEQQAAESVAEPTTSL